MRKDGERRWKVGELAQASGLTVRALHHFDEIGLVRPCERSSGGHRLYGAADVRRLYQVVALRDLGIPLADIAASLAGDLGPVVRSQVAQLERAIGEQQRLRYRLSTLLGVLGEESETSTDDLLDAMEIMMKARYFTPEQLRRLKARHAEVGADGFGRWRAEWTSISAEVRRHITHGVGPADPTVQETVRRWSALMTEMTGGDRSILAAMYAKMDGQGAEAATLDAVQTDVWEYMKRALAVGYGQ
jgi:DNA-binding transcriptional MerR regulator